jgi:hypothetical protein
MPLPASLRTSDYGDPASGFQPVTQLADGCLLMADCCRRLVGPPHFFPHLADGVLLSEGAALGQAERLVGVVGFAF